MSRVYVVRCQKSRVGNEKPPSRELAFERCTGNYNGEGPLAASLCQNEQFLNRLTETEGRRFWTPAVLFASTQQQT